MWMMKLISVAVIIFSLSYSQGEKKGHNLCDVTQWHAQFVEHIKGDNIDLSGWQSSSLRKIRYLIENYGDRKVMKPCPLLIKIRSYILEETDDDEPDLNEIDIKNYKPNDMTLDSEREDTMLKENSDGSSEELEEDEDVSSTPESHSGQPDTVGWDMNNDDIIEEPNVETQLSRQQTDDNQYQDMEIDPTDLSMFDLDYEDGNNSDAANIESVDLRHSSSPNDSGSHEVSNMNLDDHLEYFDNEKEIHVNENGDRDNVKQYGHKENQHDVRRDSLENEADNEIIEKSDQILPKHKIEISQDENDGILEMEYNKSDQDIKLNKETHLPHDVPTIADDVGTHAESGMSFHKCKYLSFFNLQYSRLTQPVFKSGSEIENMALKMQSVTNRDLKKDIDEENQKELRDVHEESEYHPEHSNENRYLKTQVLTMELHDKSKGDEERDIKNGEVERTENVYENEQRSENEHKQADYNHKNRFETEQKGGSERERKEFNINHEKENEQEILSDYNNQQTTAGHETYDKKDTEASEIVNYVTMFEEGDNERAKDNSENNVNNEEKLMFNCADKEIPDISSLLAQQEKQTTHKIDKLELNLVKLENKFLIQSLSAKDSVVSTQHIENHILKLENTLYQLNQSYNYLQRDHSALKRKQKKQNSNILRYHDILKSCPTAQPKTENNFQLISQQKSRIWELSQVVANQSLNIHQIQSRSSYLEEQNRHLFKIVLDQSALISNILSQIQELSQNSAKTIVETNELKLQFNHAFVTQNKQQQTNDIRRDSSRGPENENVDQANYDQRETLPDSAFMPLESPERNDDKEISFEKLGEKSKLQRTNENQHDNSDHEDVKDNAGDDVSENLSQTGDARVRAGQEEARGTRTPDIASTNTKEYDALANAPPTSNEDNTAAISGNIEKEQQNPKKEEFNHNILYEPLHQDRPSDCFDLYKTKRIERGMERVFVASLDLSVNVYCDEFGGSGGWTVLLRRDEGREDFYKNFDQYKEGFGSPRSEHYLGNEVIHYLTNQKHYSLRVDLADWEGNTRYAIYDQFWVDSEDDHFKLHVHGYSGTAGDGFSKHNGMKFSTFDVDNDILKKELGGSCAKRFRGAGWYYKCYQSNLMGLFYKDGIIPEKLHDGITWKPWKGPNYSMKSVTMSIRPRDVE